MRAQRLAVVLLLIATPLAAQFSSTSSPGSAPAAIAPGWSVSLDPVALVDGRPRMGFEALVFDRWTVNIAASRTRTSGVTVDSGYACDWFGYSCGEAYRGTSARYSGWSVEAAARFYPVAVSFNRARSAVAVYVAAFIGYYRSAEDRWVNSMPVGDARGPQPFPDRPIPDTHLPLPTPVSTPAARTATSWDGGAQLGVRLVPRAPAFVELTGSFSWATIGRLTSRFAAAVGVGW